MFLFINLGIYSSKIINSYEKYYIPPGINLIGGRFFIRSPVRGGRQVIKVLVLLLTARSARGVVSLVS